MDIKKKVKQWVRDAGYIEDSYHVHALGVPGGFACRVGTDRRLSDGKTTIFVYPNEVRLASISRPYSYTTWRTHLVRAYDTHEELKAILDEWIRVEMASCWK